MRSTGRATGHRAYLMAGRSIMSIANDSTMSQQGDHDVLSGEAHKAAERLQNYAMSCVPLPPNGGGGGSGGEGSASGGGGGSSNDPRSAAGWGAEGHIGYSGGNKSHPVVTHIEDRRHRPREMKPGESFNYDDQGQGGLVKRDGYYNLAVGDQNQASMRHASKEKQAFPQGGADSGKSTKAAKEHKHEGDPTSEFAAEKDKLFGIAKDLLHKYTDGAQYTLVDKDHTAIFAAKGQAVIWTDKDGNNYTTKPLEVKKYPYKAPTRSAKGANSGGGSGGGG